MKNNKKGFTLVELLAVIVILGVLLVIAVPAVTNIQVTSKQKALKDGALMLLKAAETAEAMNGSITDYYEGTVSDSTDCTSTSSNCAYYKVTTSGTPPVTTYKFTYVLEGYGVTYSSTSLTALKSKVQGVDTTIFKNGSIIALT